MDVALEHIYKVNADPDVELEDVDAIIKAKDMIGLTDYEIL